MEYVIGLIGFGIVWGAGKLGNMVGKSSGYDNGYEDGYNDGFEQKEVYESYKKLQS